MEKNSGETKTRSLLISCFGSRKLLKFPHLIRLQPQFIWNTSSYRGLQQYRWDKDNERNALRLPVVIERNSANKCYKKKQKHEFIPVSEFCPGFLPLKIRHKNVYVWLRRATNLVVKLTRDGSNTATGRLCSLVHYKNKTAVCKDKQCPHLRVLGPDHKVYGGLGVIANIHFVKSEIDAENTRFQFLYDEFMSKPVLTEKCYSLHAENRQFDYCVIACYVHDKDFIDFVDVLHSMVNYAWSQIPKDIRLSTKDYAIIISHPHGHPKQISIGRVVTSEVRRKGEKEKVNVLLLFGVYNACQKNGGPWKFRFDFYNNWFFKSGLKVPVRVTWYTTTTCNGSSGGPVFMGNTVMDGTEEINQAHTHRSVDPANDLNNCFT